MDSSQNSSSSSPIPMDVDVNVDVDAPPHLTLGILRRHFRPHQRKAIQRQALNPHLPGCVFCHEVGSGKSRTLVGTVERLRTLGIIPPQTQVIILTKRSIMDNISDEIDKMSAFMTIDKSLYTATTYETFALHPERFITSVDMKYVIGIDEAHHLSNSRGKRYATIFHHCQFAEKVYLLTGTPVQNYTREMATLINLVLASPTRPVPTRHWAPVEMRGINEPRGGGGYQPYLPMTEGVWNAKYDRDGTDNRWHLRRYFEALVSYHAEDKTSEDYKRHFPHVTTTSVILPMDPEHFKAYNRLEREKRPEAVFCKRTPFVAEKRLWEAFLNRNRHIAGGEEKKESKPSSTDARFLAYMMHLRMACNVMKTSDGKEFYPKLQTVLRKVVKRYLTNLTYKAVIYSNFLATGVNFCHDILKSAKIPFGIITGESKIEDINTMKRLYNSGSIRILLLSSAGGQGLDLHNENHTDFFEVEPHWNKEKLRQAEARVIRYSPDARNKTVTIHKMFLDIPTEEKKSHSPSPSLSSPPSSPPKKIPIYKRQTVEKTADMYLMDFAHVKDEAVADFMMYISENCVEQDRHINDRQFRRRKSKRVDSVHPVKTKGTKRKQISNHTSTPLSHKHHKTL